MTEPAAVQSPVVTRQFIFDRKREIFGYELRDQVVVGSAERDAEVLAHAVSLSDHQVVASRRVLMVGCSVGTLGHSYLEQIDPESVVLDIALPEKAGDSEAQAWATELAALRGRGFRLTLTHDALSSSWSSWLEHASFLKLDMSRIRPAAFGPLVKVARTRPTLRLIAVGITTSEQYTQAQQSEIELLQGPYFAQPELVKGQPVRPSQAVILDLISSIRRQADISEIEALIKRDAALSVNLLRFINNPGFGLSTEITSFRHAVIILGLQKLLRWACLLVASSCGGASTAAGQNAVVRGRLMELLASNLLTPDECDQAFVVGIFSMLDVMTGVPLADALERMALPETVLAALLRGEGVFAPFLELAQACEAANESTFASAAMQLQLSSQQVNMAHLQALVWAEELLAR